MSTANKSGFTPSTDTHHSLLLCYHSADVRQLEDLLLMNSDGVVDGEVMLLKHKEGKPGLILCTFITRLFIW